MPSSGREPGSSDRSPLNPSRGGSGTGGPRQRAKILSLPELLERRAGARAMGLNVVQCHGCFDIVHPGHIRHLRQARSHGDILLVSITADACYTKRGGAPLIPEELRAENLAELDCVDWVYIDPSPTAQDILTRVQPDVYIKGREYEQNNDPRFAAERAAVEAAGGKVIFSSGDVVFSSTALIRALEQSVDPYNARLRQLLAHEELQGPRLNGVINAMRDRRVVVVGETISDVYVLCDQPEVASESPVMTLRPLERRQYDGGAAIIARHCAALGARPVLVTGLPDNAEGERFRERMAAEGVEVASIPVDVPMAEKQRFLVGAQKVMKVNALSPIVLDATRQERLVRLAGEHADGADAAIIADFGNGLLTPTVLDHLCTTLRPRVRVMSGDVSGRRSSLRAFHSMDLLCPSESELRETYRIFDQSIPSVAWRALEDTRSRGIFVTLGGDGLIAFDRIDTPGSASASDPGIEANASRVRGEHVPAFTGHPVDPLGCGDTLLSVATLAMTTGASTLASATLGSLGAATQAQRLGNIPVASTDLRHAMVRLHTSRLAYAPGEGDAVAMRARMGQAV